VEHEELLRDIAALGEEFERLGAELAETARALKDHGMPPPPRALDAVEWARQGFERVRVQALALAQGAPDVAVPALDDLRSLRDLLDLLDAVAASHRRRAAFSQARETALVVLDRVQTLTHREITPFPPLVQCQAAAAELRAAVAASSDLHPDAEALVTGEHPFATLITLTQKFADVDDAQWEHLRDSVEARFGRALALAASRGKLALGAVATSESDAGGATAEVVPPSGDATARAAAPVDAPPPPVDAEDPVPASTPTPTLSAHVEPTTLAAKESLRSFPETLRAAAPPWLALPGRMRAEVEDLTQFAQDIRRLGYAHAIVVGVGGAVSVPRAWAGPFPSKLGYPELLVLDSLDPATIKRTIDHLDLLHVLFIVCARNEMPRETLALYRLCRERVTETVPDAGRQFVAITQAGSPLASLARDHQFRRTFLVPPEVSETHAALSWPGLVPAALIGVNLSAFLARAEQMRERVLAQGAGPDNPGVALGALARAGRNKVTFVLSPRLEAVGPWLEHLLSGVADGNGPSFVPVVGESLGAPSAYRQDRVFVSLTLDGEADADTRLSVLEVVDQPVYRIVLRDPLDLAGEMVRWQIAAATASSLLNAHGPRVAPPAAAEPSRTGRLPFDARPQAEEGGIRLYLDGPTRPASVTEGLASYFALARPGESLTLLSYLPADAEVDAQLHALRTALRDGLRVATRLGRSPRYLQAVGALPAGTADGLFIQVTGEDREDLAVPGERSTFGGLKRGQVLAEFMALREAGRKVLRLHMDGVTATGLRRITEIVQRAATKP
jgi:hypothetical protein